MQRCAACCSSLLPPVYFQKWVAIDNKRLFVLYLLIYASVLALVALAISLFQIYMVPVEPHFRVAMWGDALSNTYRDTCSVSTLSDLDYDPTNTNATGTGNWIFKDASCPSRCSAGLVTSLQDACFLPGELVRPEGDNTLFFATSFNEEVNLRYHGSYQWMSTKFDRWFNSFDAGMNSTMTFYEAQLSAGNTTLISELTARENISLADLTAKYEYASSPCPFPVDTTTEELARECKKEASYVVPDLFEDLSAKFAIEYQVRVLQGIAAQQLTDTNMKTIVKSTNGDVVKTIESGKVVSLTVKEAMEAAGMEFDDRVLAEQKDIPMDYLTGGRPLIQAVGMDIVLHVEVTNIHSESGSEGQPVCYITVKGNPAWMSRKEVVNLDAHGSVRARSYSGVRFSFTTKGTFSWFQFDYFFYLFFLCACWLQLPGIIFFWFAVRFLGTLSEAYSGYSFEHVDMGKEVNGVSARALSYSFAQEDMSDLNEDGTTGMSYAQAKRRLMQLLEGHKALGLSERQLLTEFFYDNTSSQMPSGKVAILFEEQVLALMSNENLRGFQDVVSTIDPDGSNRNALEYFFTDATVAALEAPRKTSSAKDSMVPHDTKAQIMNRLKLHSSMWVVQRCNLMRSQLGQEALRDQVDKLMKAGDGLAEFATKLENRF